MIQKTRKEFLHTSAALMAMAIAGSKLDFFKNKPLLSFSTLGCPDWSFQQIIDFAKLHNYSGVEIRGLQREIDITKSKEFNSKENRAASLSMMKDKGLRFIGLGSSATLHFSDLVVREKNLDEGKRFIDLANEIDCPYVRVFPDKFPKEQEKQESIDNIVKGLLTLGDYAKGSKQSVIMETHGDVTRVDDIETIMKASEHKHVGLLWDFTNMWIPTKEKPQLMVDKLKKYIRHTHIKDANLVNGKINYKMLGKGEVPVFEAIDVLSKGGYKGYYSFEWEKLWHPEIEEPELALADYPVVMKKHFK